MPAKIRHIPGSAIPAWTGEQLREWQVARGLTNDQAADLIGIPRGTYRGYAIGRTTVPPVVIHVCILLDSLAKHKALSDALSAVIRDK